MSELADAAENVKDIDVQRAEAARRRAEASKFTPGCGSPISRRAALLIHPGEGTETKCLSLVLVENSGSTSARPIR